MNNGQPPGRPAWRGTGLSWAVVVGLVLAAVVVLGIAQNSQLVEVRYLGWAGQVSLAVLLLVTILATTALTTIAGLVVRRRRRGRLNQRGELKGRRLSADGPPPVSPPPAPGRLR